MNSDVTRTTTAVDNTWPIEADKHVWGDREMLLGSSGFDGHNDFQVHNTGSHFWHSQLPPQKN